jgi:hypothetical protein
MHSLRSLLKIDSVVITLLRVLMVALNALQVRVALY